MTTETNLPIARFISLTGPQDNKVITVVCPFCSRTHKHSVDGDRVKRADCDGTKLYRVQGWPKP